MNSSNSTHCQHPDSQRSREKKGWWDEMWKSAPSAKESNELPGVREKGNQSWITLYRECSEYMAKLCVNAISSLKHFKKRPI